MLFLCNTINTILDHRRVVNNGPCLRKMNSTVASSSCVTEIKLRVMSSVVDKAAQYS